MQLVNIEVVGPEALERSEISARIVFNWVNFGSMLYHFPSQWFPTEDSQDFGGYVCGGPGLGFFLLAVAGDDAQVFLGQHQAHAADIQWGDAPPQFPKGGQLAVAHNGNLVNAPSLRRDLLQKGVGLTSSSDSEVIALGKFDTPFLLTKHPWSSRKHLGAQVVFGRGLPVDPELVAGGEPVLPDREDFVRAGKDRLLRMFRGPSERDRSRVPDLLGEIAYLRDPSIQAVQRDVQIHARSKEKGRISLVGNPAFVGDDLPAVQPA